MKTAEGRTPSGTRYLIAAPEPEQWNGILLLYCRGVPVDVDDLPWSPEEPLFAALLEAGYAVAGSGGAIFWPLEHAFRNQVAVLDEFTRFVGEPTHTISLGYSIGGIIAAGLVQVAPERLSGALPLCGNLAGAVGIHNRELDMAFVVKTLLDDGGPLQIASFDDPRRNLDLAVALLEKAQADAAGRARLALTAAVGNVPGWFDPGTPEPLAAEVEERQLNQVRWYREPVFLVLFFLRAQVERQAGGNPSWNGGVDYADLFRSSINRDEVEALYRTAGLELDADLAALAAAPRIEADGDAVAYLERNIVFSGDLGNVPVLTVHTDGDGLVTPDNQHAYRDVVVSTGQDDLLRQLYVHRGGHCSFTIAELLVALERLVERITEGTWPSLEPRSLNDAASALDPSLGVMMRDGRSIAPGFFDYEPHPFPRPYDGRDVGGR